MFYLTTKSGTRVFMRECVHDEAVRFRVNSNLLADAEAKARQQGMSLSEFLRHAVRREVREMA